MNKLTKEQFKNKNLKAKNFIAKYQIDILKDGVFPKFIDGFNGKHKKLWGNTINRLLPKNNLGFNNENDYLKDNKITKNNVIINSIKYSLPDITKEDVDYLLNYFLIFSIENKIKILTVNKKLTPVYFEIINTLDYIKKIKEIINKYPKYNANHLGTKHRSSSYKKLLETQLVILENRLDGLFFPVENKDEKEKLRIQIKFIKYSLLDEFKNLPEWMNFTYTYLGFDNPYFKMSKIEKQTYTQLITFFNGIRTSKEELLTSIMIFTRIQSNITSNEEKYFNELSESIINILRFFCNETIIEVQKTKQKKTIIYKTDHIKKEYYIKTHLEELPIYKYQYKNTNDAISELLEIGFNSIFGLQTIFDKDKPKEDELSDIAYKKSLINIKKEIGLSKEEFETCLFFIERFINQ